MISTDNLTDLETLALTIYGEARGEKIDGWIAVGCVIRNRHNSSMIDRSYKDVCLEPMQFSCWNVDDPNRVVLLELADGLLLGQHPTNSWLNQALFIASGIIGKDLLDNTTGARNYITTDLFFSDKKPAWAIKAQNIKVIGNHVFFTVV